MGDVRKIFQIDIGYSEAHQKYVAQLLCLTDKTRMQYVGSIKEILPKVKRALAQKVSQIRKFPLPQESRILAPNGAKIMMPAELGGP